MAASVLLGSADGSRLNFIPGGGGGCENAAVGNSNGLGPPGPAPWNRSVDRALDEASVTGCLNLSGRKLKEFPRSSNNHDLTDTTRAGKCASGLQADRNRCRLSVPLGNPGPSGVREKFESKCLPPGQMDGPSGRCWESFCPRAETGWPRFRLFEPRTGTLVFVTVLFESSSAGPSAGWMRVNTCGGYGGARACPPDGVYHLSGFSGETTRQADLVPVRPNRNRGGCAAGKEEQTGLVSITVSDG